MKAEMEVVWGRVVFDPNLVAQYETDQAKRVVGIKKLMIFGKKDFFLHFLLHLNEDFDDDLLFDAITLLDWTKLKFLYLSLFIFFVDFVLSIFQALEEKLQCKTWE